MKRNVDVRCTCGHEEFNVILAEEETPACIKCHAPMEQVWWKRPRGPAQWDDRTAVMVHRDPRSGDIRYVGSHDAKLKAGYERVYLRSLAEVDRFERTHGVANERMHFDRNGRGLDDNVNGQKLTH